MPTALCHHCGKTIPLGAHIKGKNSHSRFCDDTCRSNHHNEKRKLLRQMTIITGALDVLRDVEQTSQDASNIELAAALRELVTDASKFKDKQTIQWHIAQLKKRYK